MGLTINSDGGMTARGQSALDLLQLKVQLRCFLMISYSNTCVSIYYKSSIITVVYLRKIQINLRNILIKNVKVC